VLYGIREQVGKCLLDASAIPETAEVAVGGELDPTGWVSCADFFDHRLAQGSCVDELPADRNAAREVSAREIEEVGDHRRHAVIAAVNAFRGNSCLLR
jgi:hypothetical protein